MAGIQIRMRTLAAAVAFATANAHALDATLVDLGTLGGPNAYATAVSAGGVVAGCAQTASGEIHAFTWRAGAMTDLGRGAEAAGDSCALAVNDAGLAAGRASTGELVAWRDGQVSSLGIRGDVGGMNAAGAIVGTREEGGSSRAFIFENGIVTELGEAGVRSEAHAINARGQVVGASNGRAFLYEGGAVRDLGTLGGSMSVARAIAANGTVVGQASNEFGQPVAFVYRGTMQALPGPSYSSAIGIAANGRIVASAEGIQGYVIVDGVEARLADLPSVAAAGWRNLQPTAMNERGWIVGTGENPQGELRAFLLLPRTQAKPYRPGNR